MPEGPHIDDLFVPRKALFAVEVTDGASGLPIYEGILVQPLDENRRPINGAPIVNNSRRFVWTEPRNQWPAFVKVTPKQPIFEEQTKTVVLPILPLRPHNRLIRIELKPTAAYPLGEGVAGVRGQLTDARLIDETNRSGAVEGAVVTLSLAGGRPIVGSTDKHGQFLVFVRPSAGFALDADLDGHVPATLSVRRAGVAPEPWPVPKDKWGVPVPGGQPTQFKSIEQIPAGRLFTPDVNLSWPVN
jgi:hypothetical protein